MSEVWFAMGIVCCMAIFFGSVVSAGMFVNRVWVHVNQPTPKNYFMPQDCMMVWTAPGGSCTVPGPDDGTWTYRPKQQ